MLGKIVGGAVTILVIGSLFVVSWLAILGLYTLPAIGAARQTALAHFVIYAAGPVLLIAGVWWLVAARKKRAT